MMARMTTFSSINSLMASINHSRYGGVGCLAILCLIACFSLAKEPEQEKYSPYVDATGNIALPADFETSFVHLGSIAVADKADGPVTELHGTYTRKQDFEAFKTNGKFPDGAILVKDVRAVTSEKLTTGLGSYGSNIKVWFVMIKDDKGRFPDNEIWGDGWGWGLFEGEDRKKQIAVNYRTECRSCHVPAKKEDWVYTKCYPALFSKAK